MEDGEDAPPPQVSAEEEALKGAMDREKLRYSRELFHGIDIHACVQRKAREAVVVSLPSSVLSSLHRWRSAATDGPRDQSGGAVRTVSSNPIPNV